MKRELEHPDLSHRWIIIKSLVLSLKFEKEDEEEEDHQVKKGDQDYKVEEEGEKDEYFLFSLLNGVHLSTT